MAEGGPSKSWRRLVAAMRTLADQDFLLNPPNEEKAAATTSTPLESDGFIRKLTRSEKKAMKKRANTASEAINNPSMSLPSKKASEKRQSTKQNLKSRRNSLPKEFTVAICREDGVPLNEELGNEVRRILSRIITEAIMQQGLRGTSLHFAMSKLVSGVFFVTPSSAEAMEWLLERDLGAPLGHKLKAQMHNRTRITIWLPGPPEELLEDPLVYLRAQNWDREDELMVKQWCQIRRKDLASGIWVSYSVPQSVEDVWGDDANQWLFYQATRVRARLTRSQTYGVAASVAETLLKNSWLELQSESQEEEVQGSDHQSTILED